MSNQYVCCLQCSQSNLGQFRNIFKIKLVWFTIFANQTNECLKSMYIANQTNARLKSMYMHEKEKELLAENGVQNQLRQNLTESERKS